MQRLGFMCNRLLSRLVFALGLTCYHLKPYRIFSFAGMLLDRLTPGKCGQALAFATKTVIAKWILKSYNIAWTHLVFFETLSFHIESREHG